MSRVRVVVLVAIVLGAGAALFWWFGGERDDSFQTLINSLPDTAAGIVSEALDLVGYGQAHRRGRQGDSKPSAVPEPEIVVTEPVDALAEQSDTIPGSPALQLKLESRVAFVSVPKVSATLVSDSRRLVVYFPLDRFDLTAPSRTALEALAESLGAAERLFTLRVDGHCDDTGNEEYNEWLSLRRAEVVRDFLAERGIVAQSTVTTGYGERIPAVPGRDSQSRARNRRAEISIEWVERREAVAPTPLLEPAR